jgi:hypothetical protein
VPLPFPAFRPSPPSAEPGVRASEEGSSPSGASPSGVGVPPPLASPVSSLAVHGSPSPLPTPSGTGTAPPSILTQLAGPASSPSSPTSSERRSRRAAGSSPYGRPGIRSQRPQAPSLLGVTRINVWCSNPCVVHLHRPGLFFSGPGASFKKMFLFSD